MAWQPQFGDQTGDQLPVGNWPHVDSRLDTGQFKFAQDCCDSNNNSFAGGNAVAATRQQHLVQGGPAAHY